MRKVKEPKILSDFLVSEPVNFALEMSVPLEATGSSARILARLLFKCALTGRVERNRISNATGLITARAKRRKKKERRKRNSRRSNGNTFPQCGGTRKRATRLRGRGMCPAGTRVCIQKMYTSSIVAITHFIEEPCNTAREFVNCTRITGGKERRNSKSSPCQMAEDTSRVRPRLVPIFAEVTGDGCTAWFTRQEYGR
jgi:hypothetical protein